MPPVVVAVAAAVAGGAAGFIGAAALGYAVGTLGFAIAAGVIGTVVSMAVGYGLSAAFGLNRQQRPPGAQADDRKQMVRGAIEPRKVVYGRARVSGPMVYFFSSGTDQEFFHLVVPLAGHPIEAVDAIWLGDTRIPVGQLDGSGNVVEGKFAKSFGQNFFGGGGTPAAWAVRIRWHLGDQTAADPELVAASPDGWDADHVGHGLAYLYVRYRYDRDLFASGPPAVSAEVRGKRVFDPRSGLTAYSANAALCVLDYLTMEDGVACRGDELHLPAFVGAANICDEWVGLAGGGQQRRYELNGAFALDTDPLDIMDGMLTACAGTLPYIQGAYRLHVGAYDAPTDTLGEEDLAGPVEVEPGTAAKELFNAVRGVFIDPARGFQASEFPAVRDPAAEAEDGEVIWREAELPYEIDPDRAQRLSKLLLRRTREGATIKAPVRYAALRWCTWQMLAVTLPDLGYAAKPFRVVSWALDDSRQDETIIVLTLREERAVSYAWAAGEAVALPPPSDSTLVDPLTVPAPAALALTPTTFLQPDGTLVAGLLATWSQAVHPFLTGHEVQWRAAPDGAWSSAEIQAGVNRHTIAPVLVGQTLEVRVRAIAGMVRSPFSGAASGAGAPDTTAPGVPTGLAATGILRGISVAWTLPGDADLAAVEVWENTLADTAGRAFVGETRATGFVRTGLPPGATRWYWARARDRSGNLSAFAGPVSATASLALADDIADAILTTAKFAQGIAPVGLTVGVPTSNAGLPEVIFNQTDGQLYRWGGSEYLRIVPALEIGELGGQLTDDQIQSLSAAKLTGQIANTQIADGAVSTPKLAAGAVETAKLAAGAVTSEKLSVGAGNQVWNSTLMWSADGWDAASYGAIPGGAAAILEPGLLGGLAHLVPDDVGGGMLFQPVLGSQVVPTNAGMVASFVARATAASLGFSVVPGRRYHAAALLAPYRCNARVDIIWLNSSLAYVGESNGNTVNDGAVGGGKTDAGFLRSSVIGTAPAGAAFGYPRVLGMGTGTTHAFDGLFVFFSKAMFGESPPNASEVPPWSPGGVTEISGGQLRTGSVTARTLNGAEIFGNSGIFNSLKAGIASFGGLTSTEIAAGAISAQKLAAGEIITNAAQLGTAVVTSAKIGNLEVDTIKIANGAISETFAASWSGDLSSLGVEAELAAIVVGNATHGGQVALTAAMNGRGYYEGGFEAGFAMRVYVNGALWFERRGYTSSVSYVTSFWVGPGFHTVSVRGFTYRDSGTLADWGRIRDVGVIAQLLKR